MSTVPSSIYFPTSCNVFPFHHLQIEDKRIKEKIMLWKRSLLANFFYCDCGPSRAMASSFMRFLYHTKRRRTTVSRIPLYERTPRRSHLYLTTHNTTDTHPCPRRDSNPQFLQASGRRHSPYTAWPLGPTSFTIKKVKQSHYRPGKARRALRKLRFPDFVTTAQDGGRLSALRTGRLYPQNTPGTRFC